MIDCLIVDDQPNAVELLTSYVNMEESLNLTLATTDPVKALEYATKEDVQLIFLDVRMPDLNGIDFIESLKLKKKERFPVIVFTTGYDEYALPGYELGVSDYLMKPISLARFKKCVNRVTENIDKNSNQYKDYFFVETNKTTKTKIFFDEVIFIKGARNYVTLQTINKEFIVLQTLNQLEKMAAHADLFRVHKSYIININSIKEWLLRSLVISYEDKQITVPIGKTYRKRVTEKLGI